MTSVVTLVAQNQVKDNQASASNSTDHRERCKAIGRRISCQWWQHHPWTLQGIYRLDCASHIAPKRTVNRVKEDECVRVCVWGTKLSIWKFVAKNWKLSSCMNSYVCTSPAKMKPNKPAKNCKQASHHRIHLPRKRNVIDNNFFSATTNNFLSTPKRLYSLRQL